jgi:hypothetical protein
MVTVVLATIIIGAMYALYAQSIVSYRIENDVLNMQERARFGMEHLKRDLRRVGYQTTPNSAKDPRICENHRLQLVGKGLRGVVVNLNDGDVANPEENPSIQPASLTLFGDFVSGKSFRASWVFSNRIQFPTGPADPAYSPEFPQTEAEFDRVFAPDYGGRRSRYLRVVSTHDAATREFYLPIQSASATDRTVTLGLNMPSSSDTMGCYAYVEGSPVNTQAMEFSVVGFVQYRIEFDNRAHLPAHEQGRKTDLVRYELDIDTLEQIPESRLHIAEHAVDFQVYDFVFDESANESAKVLAVYPLPTDVATFAGTGLLGKAGDPAPQGLRALTAKITVRTPSEDPGYSYMKRMALYEPLRGYELDNDVPGASRTYTMAARVSLPSLAVRNLPREVVP